MQSSVTTLPATPALINGSVCIPNRTSIFWSAPSPRSSSACGRAITRSTSCRIRWQCHRRPAPLRPPADWTSVVRGELMIETLRPWLRDRYPFYEPTRGIHGTYGLVFVLEAIERDGTHGRARISKCAHRRIAHDHEQARPFRVLRSPDRVQRPSRAGAGALPPQVPSR